MLPRALRHPTVLWPDLGDVLGKLTGGLLGSRAADAPDPSALGVDVVDVGSGRPAALPPADELLVFVHGWFGDVDVVEQTADTAAALAAAGFEPDAAVALRWDASLLRYGRAEARTEDVGEALAAMLDRRASDADGGGESAVRLVGHSLGGRVVLETLRHLPADRTVDTVATLGIAADGSTVARGGRWHDAIADGADAVRNYHSRRDRVVGLAYGRGSETALGAEGAGPDADTPANYVDVDVTDSVPGHVDYPGNAAVARDLAATIVGRDAAPESTGERA